ncbi:Peptidyl-tRNA hydrolase-like protein [Glarea lozoyensis ATCC 20868]|uniref:peptidyl-tRNA hydrolase n=1 Tax=Glarea lozoyensis (strain ATCC 20868 / MF5171) TaxID=1116229 RepID=S3DDI4_GLAL2|nr:Peptidyl-tRNA hydrolase-like protein [Glarea lozoyensis ATCC 20868]EPE30051.1 Peptidyl-tRNA hydrolase-like protein [Glarea lozoyensis ATCC 20868]
MSRPDEIILEAEVKPLGQTTPRKSKKAKKQRRQLQVTEPIHTHEELNTDQPVILPLQLLEEQLLMTSPIRILVCSIGNPAPYTNTLHSAGHTVLSVLATSLAYPSFQRDRSYGNGVVAQGSDLTLWQSKSLMNVSGAGVSAAWRQFQRESRGEATKLVVVHDELELPVGEVKVRDGGASAKGHNGLKDIAKCLPGQKYKRIGVGIGRPESREPSVVAGYVLRRMSPAERAKIEGAWSKVEAELRKMQ